MRKALRFLTWGVIAVVALAAGTAAVFAVMDRFPRVGLTQRADLLAKHIQYFAPTAGGRAPLVIFTSGCGGLVGADGPNLIMNHYAEAAARAGAYAVIVDGIQARGIDREAAINQVCSGMRLRAPVRAGDILGGEELAKRHWGDRFSGVILAGWSHGGWTVMELLTDGPDARYVGNVRVEASERALKPDAVVLYYPYCGPLNSAARNGKWAFKGPLLLVTAQHDTIGPATACVPVVRHAIADAAGLRTVDLPGMTHAFDEEMQSADSKFRYSPQEAARSEQLFSAFIAEQVARLH